MRSHVAAWCLATLVLCPTLIAQPTLAPKKLDTLKRGTVFIRSEAAQRCGSGFLVARREDYWGAGRRMLPRGRQVLPGERATTA